MYLREIENLARYLNTPGLTISDICRFLVLNTFSGEKVSAVYIGEITDDGYVAPLSAFGLPKQVVTDFGSIPIAGNQSLGAAVRGNQILVINREEVLNVYPLLAENGGMPDHIQTLLINPILPLGVLVLALDRAPRVDEEYEAFLRAAGALCSFHLTRSMERIEPYRRKHILPKVKRSGVLTERQQIIKTLMLKGLTNSVIADEIGYSESLVRQETMAIYSTLNIAGRKDLFADEKE